MKQELTSHIINAASSPPAVKAVASVTVASGLVEYFDLFRSGATLTAAIIGAMLSLAYYRKAKMDEKAKRLEVDMMEYEFKAMKRRDIERRECRDVEGGKCDGKG